MERYVGSCMVPYHSRRIEMQYSIPEMGKRWAALTPRTTPTPHYAAEWRSLCGPPTRTSAWCCVRRATKSAANLRAMGAKGHAVGCEGALSRGTFALVDDLTKAEGSTLWPSFRFGANCPQ